MNMRIRSLLDAAGFGLALCLLTACPSDDVPSVDDGASDETSDPGACTPGQQVSCACPGTSDGIQVCLPDGSGYGECECGVPPNPTGDSATTTTATDSGTTTDPTATDSATTTTTTDTESGTTSGSSGTTGGSSSSGGTTGGSTGGSSSGSTGGSSSGGAGGICDMYMGGAGTQCDPWLQDCMAGDKCIAFAAAGGSWDATHCWPVAANPGQPGDVCTVFGGVASGDDTCDFGSMCWEVDPATNMGICRSLCTGCPDEPQCPDPSDFCVITNGGVLTLCLPGCDPLIQDCGAGQACYPVGDSFLCAPDASGAMGVYGDPCEFINVCDPGLMCLQAAGVPGCVGASGCCTEFCDITDPAGDNQCSGVGAGQQCVAFFPVGMAPLGYEDVGVCTL